MSIRDIILPEDRIFFDLFAEMAEIIVDAATSLNALASSLPEGKEHCLHIRRLEHDADGITRRVFESLNHSLITPLEPEEIARLAPALDDIVDRVDWVAHQICNYGIEEKPPALQEFAHLVEECAREVQLGMKSLKSPNHQQEELQKRAREINRLWNLGSDLLSRATIEVFKTGDPIRVIKLKDIYEGMETILEKCNDYGHILYEIARART